MYKLPQFRFYQNAQIYRFSEILAHVGRRAPSASSSEWEPEEMNAGDWEWEWEMGRIGEDGAHESLTMSHWAWYVTVTSQAGAGGGV